MYYVINTVIHQEGLIHESLASISKKEGIPYRIADYALAVVLFLVGLVIVTATTYKFGYAMDAVGIIGLAWGGGHFFFMAIYMLYSLGVEREKIASLAS